MLNIILDFLKDFKASGLYPSFTPITKGVNEPICTVSGKEYLLFCANNYLSLSQNEDVKNAGKAAITKYGLGPGGSRVISGDIDIIRELEKRIAKLVGSEDCLTFQTKYMVNIEVFSALIDPIINGRPYKSEDSVIFSDEYNHGSIIDGCKLSNAKKIIFKHNNLEDLQQKLSENDLPNKLIVTEGVFSLDGEILPLPEYVNLAKEFKAMLMIDDAHGVGILGNNGGGTGMHYKISIDVDIIMGCMDKAFGGTGGYLCGKKELIDYLRITSRSSVLSSAIPAMMAGAMIESVNKIEQGTEARNELFTKAKYLKTKLKKIGFNILGVNDIPSVPLFLGDEKIGIQFSTKLWERGIMCPVVRWPAVPLGGSRLRIIVMTHHTQSQLDTFANTCEIVGKEMGILA